MASESTTLVGIVGLVCLILVGFTLGIARWRVAIHRTREIRKREKASYEQTVRERRARSEIETGMLRFDIGINCLAERLERAETFIRSTAADTTTRDTRFKDGPDLEALPIYSDADEPPVYGEHTGTRLVTPPPAVHVRH
jgi:hypothetical protein